MIKNKRLPLIVVIILVVSLSLGLMAFSPVSIQNAGGPNGPGGPGRGGADNAYLAEELGVTEEELDAAVEDARANSNGREEFAAALASALGISEEVLQAARESARDAALTQALTDGNISQEEYDLFLARQALGEYTDRDEILAEALGISVSEFQAAQDEGQRIPDLLDELGISQDDFQTAVDAAHDAALAQAVSDGVITQEQADQLAESDKGQGDGGKRGPGGPGEGGRGGQNDGPRPGGNQGTPGNPAEGNG
jgi:hypothetical protein